MPGEQNFAWKLGYWTLGSIFRVIFRIRIVDARNLPKTGPGILAPNHISSLDPLLVAILPSRRGRMVHFLSGTEFFARPFIGHALRAFDQIPVKRGKGDLEAIANAVDFAKAGKLVGLFPEAKINNEERLLRGRRGAARIAIASGAPLIPVGVWGTQVRYPGSGWTWRRPWRPTVVVVFGEPMPVDPGATSAREVLHVTNALMAEVEKLRNRARAIARN